MAKLISETRLMWDMPISVAIVAPGGPEEGPGCEAELIAGVYSYFEAIDEKFSTFQPNSEISLINRGELPLTEASYDMRTVLELSEEMRQETNGYFNIARGGRLDPLGLVKGWAVSKAADQLRDAGCHDFYVEAGGDFQAEGRNAQGQPWQVGIRSPFQPEQIVKMLDISGRGVATSGTYFRGAHVDNPIDGKPADPDILSITVIGPDVYEADCYATAALAMGREGIAWIGRLDGFEGYQIDRNRTATFTPGFERYCHHDTD